MTYIQHRSDESVEDYLETILILQEKKGSVRAIDIANEMNFSKPSVSIAMKNLKQKGYVVDSEDNNICLTEEGRTLAETIYERHKILSNWLIKLGVNEVTARDDACRMEHDLSPETFAAMKDYILKNS